MIRNINGVEFKYEDGKLYRLHKGTKKWVCCNDFKPNSKGYIKISINKKDFYLDIIISQFETK